MSTEYAGRGDLARSVELLWRAREPSLRGPKPSLTVDEIVAAAIDLADSQGLAALSMRKVADQLGVATMSLYRYVPSKAELLDLMIDRVNGETDRRDQPGGWRARLEHVAAENLRLFQRHPWLVHVFPGRPPFGPGVLGKYDHELRSIDGIGLTDVEMDLVLTLVLGYVRSTATTMIEASELHERTGLDDHEWWSALAPVLEKVYDPARYPLASRVGQASSERYDGAYNPRLAFEFGLQRVLDGVETLVRRAQ